MWGHKLRQPGAQAAALSAEEKAFLEDYQADKVPDPDDWQRAPQLGRLDSECKEELESQLFVEMHQPERAWIYAVLATSKDYSQTLAQILRQHSFSKPALNYLLCLSLRWAFSEEIPACTWELLRQGATFDELPETTQALFSALCRDRRHSLVNLLLAAGKGVLTYYQSGDNLHPLKRVLEALDYTPPGDNYKHLLKIIQLLLHYAHHFPEDNRFWRQGQPFSPTEYRQMMPKGSYPDGYLEEMLSLYQGRCQAAEKPPSEANMRRVALLCSSYLRAQKEAPLLAELWGEPANLSVQVQRTLRAYEGRATLLPAESKALASLRTAILTAQRARTLYQQLLSGFEVFRDSEAYDQLPLESLLPGLLFFMETQLIKVQWRQMLPAQVQGRPTHPVEERALRESAAALVEPLAGALGPTLPRPVLALVASYAVEEKELRHSRHDLLFLQRYQDPHCFNKELPPNGHLARFRESMQVFEDLNEEFKALEAQSRLWEFALRAGAQNFPRALAVILDEAKPTPLQASLLLYWTIEQAPDHCFYECADLARMRGASMEERWMHDLSRRSLLKGAHRQFEFILALSGNLFLENLTDREYQENLLEDTLKPILDYSFATASLVNREASVNCLLQHALAFPQNNRHWRREGVYRVSTRSGLELPRDQNPGLCFPDFYIDQLLAQSAAESQLRLSLPPCLRSTFIAYKQAKQLQERFTKSWNLSSMGAEQKDRPAEAKSASAALSLLNLLKDYESGAFSSEPLKPADRTLLQTLSAKIEACSTERTVLEQLESLRQEMGTQPDQYSAALLGLVFYAQMKSRQPLWEQLAYKSKPGPSASPGGA